MTIGDLKKKGGGRERKDFRSPLRGDANSGAYDGIPVADGLARQEQGVG